MALELLAGPFTITSKTSGQPIPATISGYPVWIDGVGLLIPTSYYGSYLAQLDGSAYFVGDSSGLHYGLALAGEGSDPLGRRRDFCFSANDGNFDVDPITHAHGPRFGASPDALYCNVARLHDRYIRGLGNRIWSRPLDLSTSFAPESAVLAGLSPSPNTNSLSWGEAASEIIVATNGGQITRYDYIAKAQRGGVSTIGMGNEGLWYSRRLRVFVSLHLLIGSPHVLQVRVWATTPKPASISAPQASPAPQAGKRSTITARVLGAHNEPCAGEIVAWSLTGPGTLALAATTTDANGYATTYFDAPLAAAGDAQISAEAAL